MRQEMRGDRLLGQIARRSALGGLAVAALALVTTRFAAAQDVEDDPAPDALTPLRERYASLETYSDVGSVLVEQQGASGPLTTASGRFKTLYRAPRFFFFDYVEDPASGDDRFVIWCDGGDLSQGSRISALLAQRRQPDGASRGSRPTRSSRAAWSALTRRRC